MELDFVIAGRRVVLDEIGHSKNIWECVGVKPKGLSIVGVLFDAASVRVHQNKQFLENRPSLFKTIECSWYWGGIGEHPKYFYAYCG